uniref:Uncharacterized protein n=1 Tax=Lotus japonicus TaxID=34305 RepID=I3SHZ1_LOTJA|nr:unknown [Lotus japonicus]
MEFAIAERFNQSSPWSGNREVKECDLREAENSEGIVK